MIPFVIKMPSFVRKEKVALEHCRIQVTNNNIVRHKKRCSAGTLSCTQCPNFFTKSGDDLNYHVAKQHSAAGPSKHTSVNCVTQNFLAFMIYVNTKTLNMEHKLGSERVILMWRT